MTPGRRSQLSVITLLAVAFGINAASDAPAASAWLVGALAGVGVWIATGAIGKRPE